MKASFYRGYSLTVLLLLLSCNYMDRLAMGLVLQNIKMDLALTDTQLGFLNGIAFALFYSVMGIPIARWADRGNRITIISLTAAIWSVMVFICGRVANFTQLLVVRIAVAVGEAGCIPPAQSLIADDFPRAERPRALAIYMLGGPLSVLFGYFLAGWLNEFYGWRAMFMLLGAPGMFLAVLTWLTLKEPRALRQIPLAVRRNTAAISRPQASVKEVCNTLWANSTFRHLLLNFSVTYFFGYGILQWQPSFFVRSYGLTTGELGSWFALIYGLGGIVGTYLGGELASRYAAHNERRQLNATAAAFAGYGLAISLAYLSHNPYIAFGLMSVGAIGVSMANGPLFATIQTLVPQRMRATAIALIYLFANLIGMGLGPLAVGVLSDAFHAWAGNESLRYALLALCPGYLWAGWHLWKAAQTVERDLSERGDEDNFADDEVAPATL